MSSVSIYEWDFRRFYLGIWRQWYLLEMMHWAVSYSNLETKPFTRTAVLLGYPRLTWKSSRTWQVTTTETCVRYSDTRAWSIAGRSHFDQTVRLACPELGYVRRFKKVLRASIQTKLHCTAGLWWLEGAVSGLLLPKTIIESLVSHMNKYNTLHLWLCLDHLLSFHGGLAFSSALCCPRWTGGFPTQKIRALKLSLFYEPFIQTGGGLFYHPIILVGSQRGIYISSARRISHSSQINPLSFFHFL
jgi:hypothetical protein